jgi:hypothetical protein
MTATLEWFTGSFWADPYPAYAAPRQAAPVHRLDHDGTTAWLLTRYADVRAATVNPAVEMMVLTDPPDHTRLRRLVSREFTARRMEALRPRVRRLSRDLIEALPRSGRASTSCTGTRSCCPSS